MSQTYIIKPGDTLLQIAIEQQVDFTTLLDLNPKYQLNPDLIYVGDALTLPDNKPAEEVQPEKPVEPVSDMRELSDSCNLKAPNLCEPIDVHDVIFLTGDGPLEYYLLDEKAANELEQECKKTDIIMENYKILLESAPQGPNITQEEMEAHARKKEAWFADAKYAEMFATEDVQNTPATRRAAQNQANQPLTNFNLQRAKASKKALEARKAFVQKYQNTLFSEDSTEALRNQVIENIEKEIDYFRHLEVLADKKKPESATKVSLNANKDEKTLERRKIKKHVIEVYSINQGRYVYIRSRFHEREIKRWQRTYTHTQAMRALEQKDFKGFGKAIAEDIKEGNRELKVATNLAQWKADGNKWVEWKATQDILQNDGNTVFAVGAEAQLFRWGAQATAAMTDFKPRQGKLDIGIGADASISLAEAKAEAKVFLPHEKGFHARIHYRDANGEEATYSFGCFRLNGSISIGCFVGIALEGEGKVGNATVQDENGQSVGVMFSPRINMAKSPKGQVGFKAQGFAGGNVSGQVLGGIEWQAPQGDKPVSFNVLASISLSANIGVGGGFGADFQLSLIDRKFYLRCTGQLIWGVGGGGGFGVLIDGAQLWDLVCIIFKALQHVDYRFLYNINQLAYEYLVNSTLIAFARDLIDDPAQSLKGVINAGENLVDDWRQSYDDITNREKKAISLATRILDESTLSGIPFDQLLPEPIAIMLDVLVEEFLWSFNEQQESAICKLLRESISSWHKFEEILQRMNSDGTAKTGDKVMFDNLARINAILDYSQQNDFNAWVTHLAEKDKLAPTRKQPYTPLSGAALARKKSQINARNKDSLPN